MEQTRFSLVLAAAHRSSPFVVVFSWLCLPCCSYSERRGKGGGEPTVLTFITVTGPLTRPFLLSMATAPRWHPHPSTCGSPGLVPQVWWSGAGRDAADPADTQQRVCAESGEPFVCVTAKAHNMECVCVTRRSTASALERPGSPRGELSLIPLSLPVIERILETDSSWYDMLEHTWGA